MRFFNLAMGLPFIRSMFAGSGPPAAGKILLESGAGYIQLESGAGVILLEG